MKRRIWYVVPLAVLALGASAVPGFGADNGTVNAQVVAGSGAACLTVSTSVNFGTAQFNAVGTGATIVGTPTITVTSCAASGGETILARGTDATVPGVVWTLSTAAQCGPTGATNLYNLGLRQASGDTLLAAANTSLGTLAAATSLTRTPILRMPCTGSAGSGQTMAMSYVFTATVP